MGISVKLGAPVEAVEKAAGELDVVFPTGLVEVWKVSNGLELPDEWRIYPVFDVKEPRKSAGHIVYENAHGRSEAMDAGLVIIAGDGSGDSLVLRKAGKVLEPDIYVWDHETRKVRAWGRDWEFVLKKAKERVAEIEKQMAQAAKRRSAKG
jgi:hypothetical protein